MARPYSFDLRERVLAAAHAGVPPGAVAARFQIGESTVRGWLRREHDTGSTVAKPHAGGPPRAVDGAGAAALTALVTDEPARTLAELADGYHAATSKRLSVSTVCRACQRLDLRRKKISYAAAEQTREDVAAARAAWASAAPALRPEDLIFVDESGVATNMARAYGRATGGRRARAAVPHGRWERLTILGGLSFGGLVACLAVEGATDTAVMRAFTREVLVPVLTPGQVVVMDNLSAHKDAAVRRLIEGGGCTLLFLPPYSPDLNPIEPAWSKLKQLLRGLGACTVDALHAALTDVVDLITASDAAGYFRHCGYARYTD